MIVWILLIAGVVLVDQLSKIWVVSTLAVGESVDLIPGVFRFTYVQNEGMAFGLLSDHRWVFMVFSTLGILAMLFYLWRYRPESRLACISLSMVIGGGIGNMIDRVARSFVVDMFDFCAFPNLWMWVFNVADTCVCVGAALMMLWLVMDLIREVRATKHPKEADTSDEESGNA